MDSMYYQNTTYWVLFINIIVMLATLWLFNKGKAGKGTLATVGIIFIFAVFGLHWLFGGQHLIPSDFPGSWFYAIILIGAGLVVLLLEITSKKVMHTLSQEHLQLVQGLRVFIGAGFLMEGVLNVIPAWFSILDGFFHIASGFLAFLSAVAFVGNWKAKTPLLWIANIVGLTDIVVIVTGICFWVWDDLGPYHNMNYVVFGVGPILLWLHYNSIKKLMPEQEPDIHEP